MTICDLLTFFSPLPWYFISYTFDFGEFVTWSKVLCLMFELCIETLPQLFHTTYIWLTLFLAIQRYLYICKIATAKLYCTRKITLKIIFTLCTISFISFLPRMLDRVYDVVQLGKVISALNLLKYSSLFSGEESVCFVTFRFWVDFVKLDLYLTLLNWSVFFT